MSQRISEKEIIASEEKIKSTNNFSNKVENLQIDSEEIAKCITILEHLNNNTDQIFEIPKEQRTALIKASGQLSRPDRDEFSRRKKEAKKADKRNKAKR